MTSRALQTLIIILAALTTVSATDIFLPSLPSMADYFKATEEATQLAIPLYLLGSLLSAPVVGAFADYFERRSVMLSGMALFLLGTALCMYSPSLPFLLGARFIQGLGAMVSTVIGWAIVQDLYPKDESAKTVSWMGSIIFLAPLIAPGIGGYIQIIFGWQGNFLFIFLLATLTIVLLFFSKSPAKSPSQQDMLSPAALLKNYKTILTDKLFLLYISLYALLTCGQWCYLTVIPFYFEKSLFLSPDVFGLYLSGSALMYVLGTLFTPVILKWRGINKTLAIGSTFALGGSMGILLVSFLIPDFPFLIVMTSGIYFFGTALIWGPSTSRALQRFEDKRGAASAVRGLLLMGSFALGGFIGSLLDDSSLVPLALFLLAMALGCWVGFQILNHSIARGEKQG